MNQVTTRCQRNSIKCGFIVSVLLLPSAGCIPTLPPAESAKVRDILLQNRVHMLELNTAFTNAMASLEVVAPLEMLIDKSSPQATQQYLETGAFYIQQYFLPDIQPLYGSYTEIAPGVYDFQAGDLEVSVQKLNGIVINLVDFKYDNDDRLYSYDLYATFSELTPLADRLDISLTMYRLNQLGSLTSGPSSGIKMFGSVTLLSSTFVPINMLLEHGFATITEQDGTVQTGEQLVITEVSGRLGNQTIFKQENSWQYKRSDQVGTWVSTYYNDKFTIGALQYNVQIFTDSSDVLASGVVHYQPQGGVLRWGWKAATATGGPYSCYTSDPLASNTGTPITLKWMDKASQPLFPGTNFTCDDAIISSNL